MTPRGALGRTTVVASAAVAALAAFVSLTGCHTPMPRDQAVERSAYYLKYDRWQDAANTIAPTVKENPGDWEAQAIYGDALLNLGELEKAQDALERALAGNPRDAKITFELAEVLYRQGDANALYRRLKAAGSDMHSVSAYLLLSEYAQKLNDPDMAVTAARLAIEVDDGIVQARSAAPYIRAATLAALYGSSADERRRLRQAYGIDPDSKQVCERLSALGEVLGPSLALPPGA